MGKETDMLSVVEKWMPVYADALDDYEKNHPHWRLEVLVSVIQWGLRSLWHYIEDPRTPKISWADPFVELRYPVDWTWKRASIGDFFQGAQVFGTITKKNTATPELATKTLGEIMTRQLTAMALADLTNGAWSEKRGRRTTPVLPVETSLQLNAIKSIRDRRKALDSLFEPFAIGAAYVDFSSMKMRQREPVSKAVAAQLEAVSAVPRLDFCAEANGQKLNLSLVFVIAPLVADYSKRSAYHSITVGLVFQQERNDPDGGAFSPAAWSRQEQRAFWAGLLKTIGDIATNHIPKAEVEESVILSVNSQLKVPASCWKPENRGETIKQIAEQFSLTGNLESLSVQPAGAAAMQIPPATCPVCGWVHDAGFTQIKPIGVAAITLSGVLPNIVRLVHQAHEKGLNGLSTKDEILSRTCGGYRNPCKAFDDLNQRAAYQLLFDTRRRGFISLRGVIRE
jgi:hypothetical protein